MTLFMTNYADPISKVDFRNLSGHNYQLQWSRLIYQQKPFNDLD